MNGGRKRGQDGTLQRRVFILLRDVGSLGTPLIAERLGCKVEAARRACRHLRKRGLLGHHQLRVRCKPSMYSALPGRKPPADRRGKSSKCRNQQSGAHCYPRWLAMMTRRLGPNWRPPVRGKTTLEAVWPTPAFRKPEARQ